MPASAVALALAAAALHAAWNVALARSETTEAATAVALLFGALVFAPVAVLTWDVSAAALPYAAASGAFELVYLALLAAAYRHGDVSVVYPIARGSAPVLVLAVGVAALDIDVSGVQAAGVLCVGGGVLALRGSAGRSEDALRGLAIGVCIAGYTLLDAEGLDHADPLPYLELAVAPAALVYAGIVAARQGPDALRAAAVPATALTGIAVFAAYGLTLAALNLAPAPAVAALRESSVVIAAVLAAVVLHERVDRRRAVGAVAVLAGVALVSLG